MRVRGIEGLRVCDLSAMPNINAGNTAAPAMMLGSRCAEFVLGKAMVSRPAPEQPATVGLHGA
jgi:choline dehydrogenase-like flavoprotein